MATLPPLQMRNSKSGSTDPAEPRRRESWGAGILSVARGTWVKWNTTTPYILYMALCTALALFMHDAYMLGAPPIGMNGLYSDRADVV